VAAFLSLSVAFACGGGSGGGGGVDPSESITPTPAPTNGMVHPAGFEVGTVHGYDMEKQVSDCRTCHGADLTGGTSAVSCDSCHSAGWRTNCTFCHGGGANQTGAPPRELAGGTTASFSAHTKHVTADSVHVAYDCVQCHAKPADVLSTNHVFDGSHAALAEVNFSAGLSANGTYLGSQQCDNLYCHGDGQGDNGSYDGHFGSTNCNSCHHTNDGQYSALSGQHGLHMNAGGITCADCHSTTVNASNAITSAAKHVNGVPDYSLQGLTYTGGKCSGSCHGKGHSNLNW